MPTPASRAIARIDGSVSADMNTRVATASSCSRLRVASARGARVSASVKTDHAPVVLGSYLQTEHSPFQRSFASLVLREANEQTGVERSDASEHEQGGPARFIRRPRSHVSPRGTRAA